MAIWGPGVETPTAVRPNFAIEPKLSYLMVQ